MVTEATIYIPTRGRPENQKTVGNLLGVRDVKLVISRDDPNRHAYQSLYSDTRVLCVSATGIAQTRQAILRHAGGGKLVMMDDDLTFFVRDKEGMFYRAAKAGHVLRMLNWLDKALETHAHAGVVDKFMSTYRPRGTKEFGRYNQILGYNLDLFPKPKPKFRIPVNEEHDMHLQLCAAGLPPLISHEFSKDAPYYAKGGCSMWRTKRVEARGHNDMVVLWPQYVKLMPTKHAISGKRIQVKWRKAAQEGVA